MTVLRSGFATDVGKIRRANEDQYLVNDSLFAVADGMGGAAGGEEASHTAVAALQEAFDQDPTADGLAEGLRAANRAVWEKASERPDLRGMGTTMTAVALVPCADDDQDDDVLAIANVGDSRVYLLRDGALERITEDHSVPEELVRAGQLRPEEAATHPQRNMLTRVLGNESDVEVDCFEIIPFSGDRLILASDGLFNEVDHDDIASVGRRLRDPQEAATELVRMARDEGDGRDNITVVVVDVVDDGNRSARASAAVVATPPPPRPEPATPRQEPERADASVSRRTSTAPREKRFTVRVAAFLTALIVIAVGTLAAISFFGRGGYFVGLDHDEVVVFKGRPGGLLWLNPTIARRTGTAASDIRPSHIQDLQAGKAEGSLAAALRYAAAIKNEATTTTTTTLPPIGGTASSPASTPPSPSSTIAR